MKEQLNSKSTKRKECSDINNMAFTICVRKYSTETKKSGGDSK